MIKEFLYQTKKIVYRVIGNGKPVMLIHGFGEDGNVWENQIEYLKSRFQLIIPDLPGSGKSEMIDDMSMEGMAEVIKVILDTETSPNPSQGGALDSDTSKKQTSFKNSELQNPSSEGREACIIGHSMGGYITLALVEKYWNHVSAFGLFHSTAYPDSEEKKAIRRKGIEFIRQHGAFEFLKTTIPNLFSQRSKDTMPQRITEFINRQNNFSTEALVSYYEAMMARPDRTEVLQKTTVPLLFIMGKHDNAVPLTDGLKQCHLPEKSYIHILRKSGHMGMLEEKEKCNRILEEFLLEI